MTDYNTKEFNSE